MKITPLNSVPFCAYVEDRTTNKQREKFKKQYEELDKFVKSDEVQERLAQLPKCDQFRIYVYDREERKANGQPVPSWRTTDGIFVECYPMNPTRSSYYEDSFLHHSDISHDKKGNLNSEGILNMLDGVIQFEKEIKEAYDKKHNC